MKAKNTTPVSVADDSQPILDWLSHAPKVGKRVKIPVVLDVDLDLFGDIAVYCAQTGKTPSHLINHLLYKGDMMNYVCEWCNRGYLVTPEGEPVLSETDDGED